MTLTISENGYEALFNHMTLTLVFDNHFGDLINGVLFLADFKMLFSNGIIYLHDVSLNGYEKDNTHITLVFKLVEEDGLSTCTYRANVTFYKNSCYYDGRVECSAGIPPSNSWYYDGYVDCSVNIPSYDSNLDDSILTDDGYYPTLVYTYSGSDFLHLYSTSITNSLTGNILLLGYKGKTFTIHLSTNGYYKMFKDGNNVNRVTGYSKEDLTITLSGSKYTIEKDTKTIATLQYQKAEATDLKRISMKLTYNFIGPCCLFDFLVFSDTENITIDGTEKTINLDIIGVSAPTRKLLMTTSYESSLIALDKSDIDTIMRNLSLLLSGDHFRYGNTLPYNRPFPTNKSIMENCTGFVGWFYVFAIQTGVVGSSGVYAYAYIVMYRDGGEVKFYRFTKKENTQIKLTKIGDVVISTTDDVFSFNSYSVIIDQMHGFLYENDYSSKLIKGIVPVNGKFTTIGDMTIELGGVEKTFKGSYSIKNILFYDPFYTPPPFDPAPMKSFISVYSNMKNDNLSNDEADALIGQIKTRAKATGFTVVDAYDSRITLDKIQQALFIFKFEKDSSYTILSNNFILGETIIVNKGLDNEKSIKPFTCVFSNAFTDNQFGTTNTKTDYTFEVKDNSTYNSFRVYFPKDTIQEEISVPDNVRRYIPSFNFDYGCENKYIKEAYFLYSEIVYTNC